MSHSCLPNAVWYYDKDDFVLRARSAIAAQDEISVSYLSEDSLLESVPARRKHLKESKHFDCTCVRCNGERDFARGFRCPKCAKATFYDCSGPSAQKRGELVGSKCNTCQHPLSEAEAVELLAEEEWLQSKIEGLERRMETACGTKHNMIGPLEEIMVRSERTLSQHWVNDKGWKLLAEVYDINQRPNDAQKLVRKRLVFQEGAYTGLSGMRAWTLEGYGDTLLLHSGAALDPHVKVPSEEAAGRLASLVPQLYAEALGILRPMFGDQHEYCTSLVRKAEDLRQELDRLLGVAGDAPRQSKPTKR